jgi:hypothetical protein
MTRKLIPAALLALFVSAIGCDVAFQGLNASATDEWRRTYTLAEGGRFTLTNTNGEIEVSPSADATTVEVVAERRVRASTEEEARRELKSLEITEQAGPSEIRIEVPRQSSGGPHFGRRSREVRFTVKVPKTANVVLTTTNGTVRVSGLTGSAKLQTTNGEISARGVGGAVDAGTTNGGIDVSVSDVRPDGIRLDTTNGGINLRLPATARATISARWTHGGFEAEGLQPEGQSERRRYEGKLNGGGPPVQLSTTNGGIKISS